MMVPGSELGKPSGSVAGTPSSRLAVTPVPSLSPRVREVLRVLATGVTYEQAAASLGISRHTLHNHLRAAFDLTGASGQVECFYRLGWLVPR